MNKRNQSRIVEENGMELFYPFPNATVLTTDVEVFEFFNKFLCVMEFWESDKLSNNQAMGLISECYSDMELEFEVDK